jgi:hypothetical protein
MQLLAVDGTTQVVEAPVGHIIGDPLFFLLIVEPENLEQLPRHFNIRHFVLLSSTIIDVSFLTLLYIDIKGTTVIFDDVLAKLKLLTLHFPGYEYRVMMAVCSFHKIDRVCAEIAAESVENREVLGSTKRIIHRNYFRQHQEPHHPPRESGTEVAPFTPRLDNE